MSYGRPVHQRPQRGVSLVGMMVTIAIVGIVTGMAVPSFQDSVARRRVEGRTAELVSDLEFAKSEALSLSKTVTINFATSSRGACYVLHTGKLSDCSCSVVAPTQCKNGAVQIKTASFPSNEAIALLPPGGSSPRITFLPSRGTASPAGSITLSTANGLGLKAVVAQAGRVKVCSSGSKAMPGYKPCV